MSKNYQMYRRAAECINQGWARNALKTSDGRVCFVGGIMSVSDLPEHLTGQVIAEIDSELCRYPLYRLLKRLTDDPILGYSYRPYQAIEVWNDMPWRRKRTVVEVLERLSGRLEVDWLREEYGRLTAQVERLSERVARLEARVKELESENHGLRRLTNSYALRSDRRQLELLETELSRKWEELNALPALPA